MSAAKAIVAAVAVAIFMMGLALSAGAAFEDTANENRITNESFTVNGSDVPTTITLNESNRSDAIYDTRDLEAPVVVNEDTNTTMSSPDDYEWNRNGNGTLYIPSGSDLEDGTNTTNATVDYSYGTWTENEEQLYALTTAGAKMAPVAIVALCLVAALAAVARMGGL